MSAALIDPRPAPARPRRHAECEVCGRAFIAKSGNAGRFCSCLCANSRHDPKFIAAARRHWCRGFSISEIAAVLGVTKGVISGVKTRNDFPPRPSPIRRKAVG